MNLRKEQKIKSFSPHFISRGTAKKKFTFLNARLVFQSLGLIAFVIVLCLFSIWARVQVVGLGYDLNALNKEREQLLDENKRLKLERTVLKSPTRIEKVFGTEFPLSSPDEDHIVDLRDEEEK